MTRLWQSRWLRLGTAIALLATLVQTAVAATTTTQPRWVMGYYPLYQRDLMPPAEIEWGAMTHLAIGRVVPRADGTLDRTYDWDATQGPAFAKNLAARAKNNRVRPILMVGGAGAHDGFAAAARSARSRLVKSLLDEMRRGGFDGLDLDWEPITDSDQAPLAALVGALRNAAPNALLTLPVGWVTTTFPNVPVFYGQLAKKLDRVNVMGYGMAGAWDGWKSWHSSSVDGAVPDGPSSIKVNVDSYLKAGVPAGKLGLGVGFYGTCWAGGVSGPRQTIGSSYIAADDNVMSYTNIVRSYYASSAYRYDSVAKASYLGFSAPRGPQACTYVSYEDARSIAAKGAYAQQRGLGGAIVWTINQGHRREQVAGKRDALLKATRTAFGA